MDTIKIHFDGNTYTSKKPMLSGLSLLHCFYWQYNACKNNIQHADWEWSQHKWLSLLLENDKHAAGIIWCTLYSFETNTRDIQMKKNNLIHVPISFDAFKPCKVSFKSI